MTDESGLTDGRDASFETPEDEIFTQRKNKLERLRCEEGYDPFANDRWEPKQTLDSVRKQYDRLAPEESSADELSVAGRVMTLRRHGKAAFADLMDETGAVQLYFQHDALGEDAYSFFKKWVD
ncbi:MAG: hypothetical protein LBI74_05770, partial [Synergistaceae bacterium]|nr:hypothetical protein [Synergistaceae bacterium]